MNEPSPDPWAQDTEPPANTSGNAGSSLTVGAIASYVFLLLVVVGVYGGIFWFLLRVLPIPTWVPWAIGVAGIAALARAIYEPRRLVNRDQRAAAALASARTAVSADDHVGSSMRLLRKAFAREQRHRIPLVPLSIGVVIVAVTTWLASGSIGSPPTCGGQVMKAGDECVSYRSGSSSTTEEVATAPIHQPWFWIVIAAIALGVWWFGWMKPAIERRKAERGRFVNQAVVAEATAYTQAANQAENPEVRGRVTGYNLMYWTAMRSALDEKDYPLPKELATS